MGTRNPRCIMQSVPVVQSPEHTSTSPGDHGETFLDVELSPKNQQDLITLLQLDLAPLSPLAMNHTFLGFTIIGWLVAPQELIGFFGIEEAVERWHRQYESSSERRSLRRASSH
ncbi:hypothetical protein [Alsobacter sp. SYSU BS001988]